MPPLPDTCLPRCRAETREPWFECTTPECALAALDADPTPPAVIDTLNGDQVVGCGYPEGMGLPCILWQLFSCDSESCPDEYVAWASCVSAPADCSAETSAVEACRSASSEWEGCYRESVNACFGS